ncbi:CPBP family intramembrane glutamic endopeptidase [Labedella endophytica]|nr:CPBP family intramembrane glutamic endopeptidase [Labedella endophytica]
MSAPRRWSLMVPLAGLAAAVLLLPFAGTALVPEPIRELSSYLVVWIPLVAAVVVAVRLAMRRRSEPWWRTLRLPLSVMGAAVGVFVGLAARTAGVILEVLVTGRIGVGPGIAGNGATIALGLATAIVASVILAPVIEESFFRGALLPAVEERFGRGRGRAWLGIALVAIVFAAVHALAGGSPLAVAITLLAGVGFGAVARAQGVGSAMVAHVVFNASGLVLTFGSAGVSPLPPTLALG